ncbi:MAG: hypothetical protein QM791_21485 [Ferruginibacter sp.]
MKISLTLLCVSFLLFGCDHSNKELKEHLIVADSIAINYFKGDGTMDTVITVKIISDKQLIGKIAGFISEAELRENKSCGYDGSLHFFKNNMVIQDVDFRMNDEDCMRFTAKFMNKIVQTSLSADAKKLLQAGK